MGLMSSRDEPLHNEADGALLSADTLDALGLHSQPFLHAVPDHGRFLDETTESQLDDVRQALIAGDDLLLVLGPPGSGRSILLDVLNDDSGTRIQCFQVAGSERFDTDNLFAGMLEAFKQPAPEDLKLALDELIPCLQGMDERNTLCVVIVDDAEAVDDNELTRLLSSMLYLNSGDETLLRMVFAASEDFEDRIPDLLPEGADLPYSILGMEPLEDDRAADFLAFRLEQAGYADALPFDEEDIAMLNDRASGRPGTLQSLAAETLNERFGSLPPATADTGFASSLPSMDDKRRKLVFGAVAAILILTGLLLFLPSADDAGRQVTASSSDETEAENAERLRLVRERANEERAQELAAAEAAAAQAEADDLAQAQTADTGQADNAQASAPSAPSDNDSGAEADTGSVATSAANADNGPGAEGGTEAGSGAGSEAGSGTGSAASADAGTPVEEPPAPATLPEPVAEPAAAATPGTTNETASSDDEPAGDADINDGVDTSVEAPAPETSQGGSLSAEELAAEDPNAGTGVDQSEPIETAELPLDTAPASSPEAGEADVDDSPTADGSTAGTLESPNWILVQAPDQFTVQLIAAIDRQSVDNFLQRSSLPSPNSVFSFERDGVAWYAMVHGLYPTIEAATAAIEEMPEDVRRYDPWIRSIGRLQRTVRE